MAPDTLQLGGILALSLTAFKLVELVITKAWTGKTNGHNGNGHCKADAAILRDIQSYVEALHELSVVRDADGTPMIYAPRRTVTVLEELLNETRQQRLILQELLHERRRSP